MNISSQDEKKLEEMGWTIECYSPLEISYVHPDYPQDGRIGFASGVAAKALIESLLKDGMLKEDN